MRRFLIAALAALFFIPLSSPAATRVIIYSGQGWNSTQANQQARFYRLAWGTWMRDALGPNVSAGGVYTNLTSVPNGGMYVAVQPTAANSLGALYQIAVSDPAAVPAVQTGNQIPADPTNLIIQATQSGPSGAIGPLVAPASGLSQYYLVEAQVQTQDTSPQSLQFYAANKSTFFQTVDTQRVDEIVYQLKPGVPGTTPAIPTVDSGWIGVSTVLVPSGSATITSQMVSALPAFAGFVANGTNVTVSGLTISTAGAGCAQTDTNGKIIVAQCTSGLGTVNGTSPINSQTVGGVATVTCVTCVTNVTAALPLVSSGGTTPQISMSTNPSFTTITAGSATVNGNASVPNAGTATSGANYGSLGSLQVENSLWNGSAAVQHIWGITSDSTGKLNFNWDAVPKWSLDSSGNVTATKFTGSGAGLTSGSIPGSAIAANGVGQGQVANGYVDLSSAQTIGGQYKTFTYGIIDTGSGSYPRLSDGGSIAANVGSGFLFGFGTNGTNSNLAAYGCAAYATHTCLIKSGGDGAVSGVTPTQFEIGELGVGDQLAFDGSNLGILGSYQTGSSTYGPTSATINGPSSATQYTSSGTGFIAGTSTYGPTSATVNGPITTTGTSGNLVIGAGSANYNAQINVSTAYQNPLKMNNIATNGVNSTFILGDSVNAFADAMHLVVTRSGTSPPTGTYIFDDSGNLTAANFFNGSRRAYKFDIHKLNFDALGILKETDWASYRYKPKYGDPKDKKIGFIADDTPAILSGQQHNHFDAGALATVDAQAILQLSRRMDGLESMVRTLCKEKKNRKEAVCRVYRASGH